MKPRTFAAKQPDLAKLGFLFDRQRLKHPDIVMLESCVYW